MIYFNCVLLLLGISAIGVHSEKGCIALDTVSFDKILSKFKAVLVKFDAVFPYGSKQEAYESVCSASRVITELLVTEVSVKDYGDKENLDLAQKFGVHKNDYPVVKLFINGQEAHTFRVKDDREFNEKNLKNFIRAKSGVYIGLDGCYEDFDNLALNFTVSTTKEEKQKYLEKAEFILRSTNSLHKQKAGEMYVKYMKKSLLEGDKFINQEENRIKTITEQGKIHITKRREFDHKINILNSFKIKDEL
ncbi:endoplasmic reticulum resident protein 29 [Nilaparvata lugens]|uniref:endoplasmic reticulum resident protein 29 n=1 Tax=Nilaparvata lugens TaxID=108931 RepID=UPI00193D91F9|nr:endoplasmic reticulum resident protein 29 [Nilaparvata lugens]